MPPKKAKGGKKKKNSGKPEWMSEELYQLTQNLPKLQEFWCGEVKETKGKGKDGQPLPDPPNITKEQAGRYMLALLFPNNKVAKERRQDCIKLQVIETSIKILVSGKPEEVQHAMGIIASIVETIDQARQIMLDNKPAPLSHILKAFHHESASLKASVCNLFRVLCLKDDSRPRIWKAMKEFDWSLLFSCLQLQDRSQLGGRNAALDATTALAALCSAPEPAIAQGACNAVIAGNGLRPMVQLLSDRVSHPMTRAAVLSVLNAVMRRNPSALSEEVVLGMGALKPLIYMFDHAIIPLINKSYAAACLLRFIMPDSLWKDSSALSPPASKAKGAKAAAAVAAAAAGVLSAAVGSDPAMALPSIADPTSVEATPATAGMASTTAAATAGSPGGPNAKAEELKALVIQGLETDGAAAAAAEAPAAIPDALLLDEETKAEIMRRARIIAEMGAIRPLVLLCNGPDGPLPDLEAKVTAPVAPDAGEKKKKPKKKKGKGKLEPGMAEAQVFASAVLRLISLDDAWRVPLVQAGVVRYMVPLLDVKLSPARWNARQLLVNLSMTPQLMSTLQLYKVPNYVHGANVPGSHFERPYSLSGDDLERVPDHLSEPRKNLMSSRLSTTSKPPALRGYGASAKPTPVQVSG
ncbi:hypothetical protein CEUSTIGMA_g1562.t1 [Chlamydomonas eustigma]|uniref:Armadillo repeat-containing domain-containing protein n=1 Tax=Chlamydomonas eustigma TaxID=1157962 RepID=A0A250WTH0_9CHLO|nr:hypothetical protein CEUSTIGMA_g1562.t1 [Chlamydomonas eustigma]|eukprot:GAX74113.1 hypothetical protein CEUSTIGMA_g1562.t1 [Chlamydomonas eustigma]